MGDGHVGVSVLGFRWDAYRTVTRDRKGKDGKRTGLNRIRLGWLFIGSVPFMEPLAEKAFDAIRLDSSGTATDTLLTSPRTQNRHIPSARHGDELPCSGTPFCAFNPHLFGFL